MPIVENVMQNRLGCTLQWRHMSDSASQITDKSTRQLLTGCEQVGQANNKENVNLVSLELCEGNPPVTVGFVQKTIKVYLKLITFGEFQVYQHSHDNP